MTTEIHGAALSATVQGPVLFAGDPRIAAELAGFNLAVHHQPHVVVGATRSSDVAAAVRYATRKGLAVVVHATGHGSLSTTDAVIVTTRRLQRCHIDPVTRTATIGAGVTWSTVIEAAAPHGLAPLSGSSAAVGAVGYTLGGGTGPMVRRYGFAADHVLSFELVTAEGEVRVVDATREPDLFWAVRGGKGNFGVVTSMTFRLHPVGQLFAGAVFYSGEHAAVVLRAWRDWAAGLGEETTTSVGLLRAPDIAAVPEPLRGKLSVHLRFAHLGDEESGRRLLAPLQAAAPVLIDTVRPMSYPEVDTIYNDPTEPMPVWSRGAFLAELPDPALDTLLAQVGPGVQTPLVLVGLLHLGGAAGREPAVANAVSGRDAAFAVNIVGPLPPPLADVVPAVGNRLLESLRPWATGVEVPNFSPAPQNPGSAWTAETYQRLLAVKRVYDPTNTFRTDASLIPGSTT